MLGMHRVRFVLRKRIVINFRVIKDVITSKIGREIGRCSALEDLAGGTGGG